MLAVVFAGFTLRWAGSGRGYGRHRAATPVACSRLSSRRCLVILTPL